MNDSDRERLGQPTASPAKEAGPIQDFAPGEGMRMWGWVFMAMGIILAALSWFIPITVHVGASYSGEDIVNAYRIQIQTNLLVSGLGLLLVGAVLYAAGKIVSAIEMGRSERNE